MGKAGIGQRASAGKLVVGGGDRTRAIQDPNAGALESPELPESDLDPVESLRHIEACYRGVALDECGDGDRGRKDPDARVGARKRDVGRCPPVGDDGEGHRPEV